jgi:hypothetical protein
VNIIRSILAVALLLTPLGMLWVFAGDDYLLSSGLYAFIAVLWGTHFGFWILYLAVVAPLFGLVVARGREPSEFGLASVVAGLAGLGYLIWASAQFLHRNTGFFTTVNLAINAVIFLAVLAAAAGLHFVLRKSSFLVRRASIVAASAGLLTTVGLWGATFAMNASHSAEVSLDPLEEAGEVVAAASTGMRRVTLMGLDGADWLFVDDLIARGELPAFARLKSEGVTAPMETISPFSPVVWTSLVTGMDPGRHGVQYFSEMYLRALDLPIPRLHHNFLEPIYSRAFEKIPVSSTTRTAKAIWEIAGAFGMKSLVMNWWASFPAEPGEGYLISNYAIPWDEISAERLSSWDGESKVSPDDIWPVVLDVMRKSVEGGIKATSWQGDDPDEKITKFDFWDLRDRIVLEIYDKLDRPEHAFTAVYLQGIDTTSHHASETVFGRNEDILRDSRVDEAVFAQKRAMVDEAYRRMDVVLGSMMERMGEGDLLAVVSDHGWRLDGTSHWRMPDGIFGLYGSGVRKGFSARRVHVYDVTPTLLYCLGLPLSRELPGRILEESFDAAAMGRLPRSTVATYGRREQPMRMADPATDAAYRERLKSLGYLQ